MDQGMSSSTFNVLGFRVQRCKGYWFLIWRPPPGTPTLKPYCRLCWAALTKGNALLLLKRFWRYVDETCLEKVAQDTESFLKWMWNPPLLLIWLTGEGHTNRSLHWSWPKRRLPTSRSSQCKSPTSQDTHTQAIERAVKEVWAFSIFLNDNLKIIDYYLGHLCIISCYRGRETGRMGEIQGWKPGALANIWQQAGSWTNDGEMLLGIIIKLLLNLKRIDYIQN